MVLTSLFSVGLIMSFMTSLFSSNIELSVRPVIILDDRGFSVSLNL